MKPLRRSLPLLNALAVFESAARRGSLTAAAQEIGISQSAVSRHVSNLESQTGLALFRRDHNKIAVTEAGRRLAAAVASGLGHVKSVLDELQDQSRPKRLTIACSYDVAHLWLMPRLAELRAGLPDRELRLLTSDSYLNFDADDIDLSIRFGAGRWPGWTAVKLFAEEAFPVCAPALLDAHPALRRARAPADLRQAPLLHLDTEGEGGLTWRLWFRHFGIVLPDAPSAGTFTSYMILIQAALEGRGAALGWRHILDDHLARGTLVRLTRHCVRSDFGLHLVHRTAAQDPALARVVSWLRDSVRTVRGR